MALLSSRVPRITKIVHSWKTEYLAEAPRNLTERTKARDLWLSNPDKIVEPFPNGHIRFNSCIVTVDELHNTGLKGWWE
jgi:hypothetical protein